MLLQQALCVKILFSGGECQMRLHSVNWRDHASLSHSSRLSCSRLTSLHETPRGDSLSSGEIVRTEAGSATVKVMMKAPVRVAA